MLDYLATRQEMLRELAGERCYWGLDLSSTTDTTAAVLIFPDRASYADTYPVLPFFWLPEAGLQAAEERDRVPYRRWTEEGLLVATPGVRVDYDAVEARLLELAEIYPPVEIAVDPWNATTLSSHLLQQGLPVIEVRQNYQHLSPPTKLLEVLVLERRLAHGGNPILRWQALQTGLDVDPHGGIKPSKADGKRRRRIDGIVALVTAMSRMPHLERPAVSPYDPAFEATGTDQDLAQTPTRHLRASVYEGFYDE